MKSAGISGGIGPESTVEYYRQTIALYRELSRDGSYPPLIINSIDLQRMLDLAGTDERELPDYLVRELERLAGAGAAFAVARRATLEAPTCSISVAQTLEHPWNHDMSVFVGNGWDQPNEGLVNSRSCRSNAGPEPCRPRPRWSRNLSEGGGDAL